MPGNGSTRYCSTVLVGHLYKAMGVYAVRTVATPELLEPFRECGEQENNRNLICSNSFHNTIKLSFYGDRPFFNC